MFVLIKPKTPKDELFTYTPLFYLIWHSNTLARYSFIIIADSKPGRPLNNAYGQTNGVEIICSI